MFPKDLLKVFFVVGGAFSETFRLLFSQMLQRVDPKDTKLLASDGFLMRAGKFPLLRMETFLAAEISLVDSFTLHYQWFRFMKISITNLWYQRHRKDIRKQWKSLKLIQRKQLCAYWSFWYSRLWLNMHAETANSLDSVLTLAIKGFFPTQALS